MPENIGDYYHPSAIVGARPEKITGNLKDKQPVKHRTLSNEMYSMFSDLSDLCETVANFGSEAFGIAHSVHEEGSSDSVELKGTIPDLIARIAEAKTQIADCKSIIIMMREQIS